MGRRTRSVRESGGAQEAEDLRKYFHSALSYFAVNPVLFHASQQSAFIFGPNRDWQPSQRPASHTSPDAKMDLK